MGGGGFPALRPAAAAAVKLVYRLIAFLSGRSCFLSRQTLNSQIQDFINQTSLFHFFFTFFFSVLPFPYIMFSTLFLLYLTSIKILQFVLIAVLVRLHKCVNVCHWHCSCVNVYSVVFMCHKLKFVWWQKGSLILLHVCFFHTNVCKHSSSLVYYSTKVKFVFKYVCQGFKNTHRALEIALYSTPLYGFQPFKL